MFLSFLASLCAAYAAAALMAAARPRLAAPITAALSGLGALAALAYLLAGAPPATLALPIGLPGTPSLLALDGLSAFFLLILCLAATAAASSVIAEAHYPNTAPMLPLFTGGMSLTLLAGDAITLLSGFEAMSLASFLLVLTQHREDPAAREAALLYAGMAALGALCLIAALALLAHGTPTSFATLRTTPPEGPRALVILALALIGAGSKAGLAPLHTWLPPAHAAAPAHISALMSGVMTKIALYVLARILFDLCGPAQPIWFGLPLIALGAASAVLGALRANTETDIKAVLACSTIENIGLIAIGLGIALLARAADLPALASLAAAAALLHIAAHASFKPLLFLAAGAIQSSTGTRRLDRLGGLIHGMPLTAACMILAAASLAALPPTAGFAGEWLLLQAAIGAPRIGGLGLQIIMCIAAALMALAAALAAAAAVRLVGIALLGRPRSPRAAAAEDPAPPTRWAMLGLALTATLIGLLPGPILRLLTPAITTLAGAGMGERAGLLTLAPALDTQGYIALTALLLPALTLAILWRLRPTPPRQGPAWDCGFGADTARLPFGEPLTQYSAAGFSQPIRRTLGTPILAARETIDMPPPGTFRPAHLTVTLSDPATTHLLTPIATLRDHLSARADSLQFLTIRRSLAVMVWTLVLFLAVVALVEQL